MRITRTSVLTGITRQKDIPVTIYQLSAWVTFKSAMIQRIMSHLPEGEREFLISGIPEEEWDTYISSFEITEYIPDELESTIVLLPEEDVKEVLRLIAIYKPEKPIRNFLLDTSNTLFI